MAEIVFLPTITPHEDHYDFKMRFKEWHMQKGWLTDHKTPSWYLEYLRDLGAVQVHSDTECA